MSIGRATGQRMLWLHMHFIAHLISVIGYNRQLRFYLFNMATWMGRYGNKSASSRLPGLATTKTASAPCISNKGICSVNGEHHLNSPTTHSEDIDSCSLNVSPCTSNCNNGLLGRTRYR
ncbi:putative protein isoform X1 [Gossypium australe]|uniref:Uncharacterized protein n=1 Tax=Gossypium australe TaxID=47621 RepID=A0A5B6WWS2_9ROSI|nr:putative protein isoform X1 [Gossypium australe]